MRDVKQLEDAWADFSDVGQLSRAVVVAARRAAAADGATFVLRDENRCFYAMEDAMSPLWQGQRFPIDACISGWAMNHNETAIVPNIELDERIPIEAYRPTFVRSLAMTPVGAPEPVAAIGVYWSRVATPEPEAVAKVAVIAEAAANVLARIGLHSAPSVPLQR
jgi:hypothetical protein